MLTPDGVLKQGSDPVRQAGLRNRGVDLSAIYPARHGLVKPREVLTLTSQEAEVPVFVTKNVSSNGVAAVGGRLSLRSGERACGVQMGRSQRKAVSRVLWFLTHPGLASQEPVRGGVACPRSHSW